MIVVNLKKSKRIVSRALLAFAAIVIVDIVIVNFSVLNEASMKFLPATTVISDRRFQADLSLKRLSRRLSQEKEPLQEEKEPPVNEMEPPQDTRVPSSDIKDPPKVLSIPFCAWKDSNTNVGDIIMNQTTEAKHLHNFSKAYEEQQYFPLCPQHSPLLRGRTEVYQGNITWEQAQVNKSVRFNPL